MLGYSMMQKSYPSFFLSIYPSYHIYWLVVSKCMKFSCVPSYFRSSTAPNAGGTLQPNQLLWYTD